MKKITLEMSLKPFKCTDRDYIRKVCYDMFMQWRPLLKNAKEISVMLWTSDGSEILDYAGNLDDEFEWCCYIGTANNPIREESDRPDISLHKKKRYYIENPPVMTYRILKDIISILKEEGKKVLPDAVIRVGETFDIGPEFAVSDFKYNRHTEICSGTKLDKFGFVDSTARLNGDTRKYAAYPDGIADGTPFGLFLGKQSNIFLKDMGFDYIWLSNGLGFSAEPWTMTGKIFDGEKFYPERLEKLRMEVFEFWKYFREGCPNYPVETRGTNNSAGIDYATDGVPLYDIYNGGFNIEPPPNSPWAALNGDYGLEIMGHMSRICELPGEDFLFRYYVHDPWWVNSPWYDRYQQQPHDIYLPMAIARITTDGKIQSAEHLNILSVDNSYGNMPDSCVNEPIPHLLKAIKDESDEPSPFVWVYPVREYTASHSESDLKEMYFGDTFIKNSINQGFPLNCVVSSDNFCGHDIDLYKRSVIISPVPMSEKIGQKLNEFADAGQGVIVYGTVERLNECSLCDNITKVNIDGGSLIKAIEKYGYIFKWPEMPFNRAMTVNKSENGYIFSVFNMNTSKETRLRFPIGAPIFMNGETEIKNGCSVYHFGRGEHRECRVFVDQTEGEISVYEEIPSSDYLKRRIDVCGLKDATVCLFPETYCIGHAKLGNKSCLAHLTPEYFSDEEFNKNWEWVDDAYGSYLKGKNITGDLAFYMISEKFVG